MPSLLTLTLCALQIYLLTYFTYLTENYGGPRSDTSAQTWSGIESASWSDLWEVDVPKHLSN